MNILKKCLTVLSDMSEPIKKLIMGYFSLVLILILSYYIAWLVDCINGNTSLPDLLAVIKEMTGPAMIAFMTFIAGCFIDLNHNGIPDNLEGYNEKDNIK